MCFHVHQRSNLWVLNKYSASTKNFFLFTWSFSTYNISKFQNFSYHIFCLRTHIFRILWGLKLEHGLVWHELKCPPSVSINMRLFCIVHSYNWSTCYIPCNSHLFIKLFCIVHFTFLYLGLYPLTHSPLKCIFHLLRPVFSRSKMYDIGLVYIGQYLFLNLSRELYLTIQLYFCHWLFFSFLVLADLVLSFLQYDAAILHTSFARLLGPPKAVPLVGRVFSIFLQNHYYILLVYIISIFSCFYSGN